MEKKNNNLIIIILFVIILGLGGFIIYDKLLKDNETSNNTNNDNQSNNSIVNKYNYDLSKRISVQAVRNGNVEIIVDLDGDTYLSILGDPNNEKEEKIKRNLNSIKNKFKNYSPKGYVGNPGEEGLNAYKLDNLKTLTTYYVHVGNGGQSYFVFIKENGNLAYLKYDDLIDNGEIILKNIDGLKNIVSIVENTYSMTPYAISLDGTEINLNDYLK